MELVTKGVVLAEHQTVDAQRMIFLYTLERGVIMAFVKSAKGMKNKFYAGLQLFQYCEFTLTEKYNLTYVINDIEVLDSFFAVSKQVETLTLATYCADLTKSVAPEADDAKKHLPLFLNTLHLLRTGFPDLKLLKLIFELRTMSLTGYMPDLIACSSCFGYKEEPHYFDKQEGYLLCYDCASGVAKSTNVNTGGVALLRHVVYADDKTLFGCRYSCPDDSIYRLVEHFALWNIDRYPQSLDMFNKLMTDFAVLNAPEE